MRSTAVLAGLMLASCATAQAPDPPLQLPQPTTVAQAAIQPPPAQPSAPATQPVPRREVAATRQPPPAPTAATSPSPPRLVIVVLDGDTVEINGSRWRLQGVDAPEIERARCDEERRLGELAKRRLQQVIGTARQIDAQTKGQRDAYGRVLGRIIVDGVDVASVLREEGLAAASRRDWCVGVVAPAPRRPVPKATTSPCRGLARATCTVAIGCRWVQPKPRDKNGRALPSYCRKAGRG